MYSYEEKPPDSISLPNAIIHKREVFHYFVLVSGDTSFSDSDVFENILIRL